MNKNNFMFNILIAKHQRIVVCLFFILYLWVGMKVFDDYGISWDEHISRRDGVTSLSYILGYKEELLSYKNKYYGSAFEIFLVLLELVINPFKNARTTYLIRHFATFLLFYIGVIFFYKLCKYKFASWRIGLLGSLFLILSPRIFAHSFYNSKDIPCLSMFIIAMYTLMVFLNKKTIKSAFLHALACAVLIDIRIAGTLVPFVTIIFLLIELWSAIKNHALFIKDLTILSAYVFALVAFTILFWPILWSGPVYHFINALKHMSHYPWEGSILYLGKYIKAASVPWHYIPVWIAVSTPLVYIIGFIIGCFILIIALLKTPVGFYLKVREDLILILWFFLPLFSVVALHSVLYDEWRHLLFIYPALLMITLTGLKGLFRYVKIRFQGLKYSIINAVLILAIAGSLIRTVYFMVKNHPFQNVYFNILAGADKDNIRNNFELDYWGLSYRQALEYVLKNDPRDTIKVHVANSPGEYNANILISKDRARVVFVDNLDEADYFLSNYRGHREEYSYKECYSIKADGLKIMVVYRMNT